VTQATICLACDIGKYSKQAYASRCIPCDIGSYQSSTGQVSCVKCPPGSYSLERGVGECSLCNRHESSNGYDTSDNSAINGLTCDTSEVHVESGYYAWRSWRPSTLSNTSSMMVMVLSTSVCGRGRCAGGWFTSPDYEPCSKDRDQSLTNILCGRCREGYMEFGASCIGITSFWITSFCPMHILFSSLRLIGTMV
jgi:hypothetical protein